MVVPVQNEAENVRPLLAEIHRALEGVLEYEVIYVDDGSTDSTPEVLSQCALENARLRVLRHSARSGQSAALASGVRAARANWIATLDGDGQNDPADIPAMWERLRGFPAEEIPGMICGQRVKRRDTWLKRAASRIANRSRGWILHDGTPDSGCGLKVFRRDIFLKLPHFDHMHRFLPALYQMAGARAVSFPVHHRPRTQGRSHYGVRDRLWAGIADILGMMWLRHRMTLAECVELDGAIGERIEAVRPFEDASHSGAGERVNA